MISIYESEVCCHFKLLLLHKKATFFFDQSCLSFHFLVADHCLTSNVLHVRDLHIYADGKLWTG